MINWARRRRWALRTDTSHADHVSRAAGVLEDAHVLVVGMGGVGGYAADAIARSGVGEITPVAGLS